MFEFKAYIWDNQVYIGDRAYKTNEILNECLNEIDPEQELLQWLRDLHKLLSLLQILDDDYEKEKNYDEHVQYAQQLFYNIGNTLKRLPPYNQLSIRTKLDEPLLFDCLNANYNRWETGAGDIKSDLDFANEFGFMQRSKSGKYSFYVQRFQPAPDDVMNCEDNPFIFEDLNKAVKEIFDLYIAVLKDFLRVKLAYTEFLDKYIHGESKFLSDTEIANRFIKYAKDSERKHDYERLISSSSMKMGHEVYRRPDGKAKLCEVYAFDSLGAFLYFDFFRGLSQSYIPKRCDNCGMYFLLEAGKYSSYCERPLEDDPEKTCRDVGARKKYGDKCKTDPVWLAYNRAYKTHYARYMKKKMTIAEFEQWSRQAIEWRNQTETGELEQAEYERLLKK